VKIYSSIHKNLTMEIDVNIVAHDLLWRSMSLGTKKAYREAYGAARDALVNKELQRLVEAGYVVRSGNDVELTPGGKDLYKKMTTICKKSE
jgi:ribosomal protein S19E (S16A)